MRALLNNKATTQLLRFVVAGLGVTACSVLVYLVYAVPLGVHPLLATIVSHFAGVALGYAIHSRWSFRESAVQTPASLARFVATSGVALALNAFWVWLATGLLSLPAWTPVPAMLFVTPLASFALNRYWVFAAAD